MDKYINAVIGLVIVLGMFYLAYAGDDREDISRYESYETFPKSSPSRHQEGSSYEGSSSRAEGSSFHSKKKTLEHDYVWDEPKGWKPSSGSSISLAAFTLGEGDLQSQCVVTQLGGTAGGVVANVNRWRSQVGLDVLADEKLLASLKKRQAKWRTYDYVLLINEKDKEAIAASLFMATDHVLFVKLTGSDTAVRHFEQEFLLFCDSINKKGNESNKN